MQTKLMAFEVNGYEITVRRNNVAREVLLGVTDPSGYHGKMYEWNPNLAAHQEFNAFILRYVANMTDMTDDQLDILADAVKQVGEEL